MEFVLPNGMNTTKAPAPKSSNVILKDIPAELIAVKEFSGICTEGEISRQRALLEDMLLSDGILYDNLSFRVLQYNPPYTLPWLRRNEVSLKIDMDINQIRPEASQQEIIPHWYSNRNNSRIKPIGIKDNEKKFKDKDNIFD